jgi:hypothetical protein
LIFSSESETAVIDIGNANTRKKYVRSLVVSIETA